MIRFLKRRLPAYHNREILEKINDLIHDETDRTILRFKLVDNYTLMRVSDTMDIPLSTVRDRYYRGLDILFPRK